MTTNASTLFVYEFTDIVFIDEQFDSILLSVSSIYLDLITQRFREIGYELKHATSFRGNKYVTCVFLKE